MGQDTFLKLLTTQMQNQDPMNPQSSEAFVEQLATFSSLEQLMGIQSSLEAVYMGIASIQMRMYDQAIAFLKRAEGANPGNITPHLYMAEVYWKMGNERSSRQEADKIVGMMMQNKRLFGQTMDLILGKGATGKGWLSPAILVPLLSDACRDKPVALQAWKESIEKTMENKETIEYDR